MVSIKSIVPAGVLNALVFTQNAASLNVTTPTPTGSKSTNATLSTRLHALGNNP
jgi:hypothetical protein